MKSYEYSRLFLQKIYPMERELFIRVDDYISGLFISEDEALTAATASIKEAGIGDMSISPVQGSFLQLLVKLTRAGKILELGTFAGYSTIWLARGLPEHGRLITMEFDPVHAGMAEKNIRRAGLEEKVSLRVGKAIELLPELAAGSIGPFDLIFIDADKPPYAEYFEWALKLSRPGTLIIFDNVIRDGKVLDPLSADAAVIGVQRLNKLLAADQRVTATVMTTVGVKDYDGMAIVLAR
jgi:caffeoyl-CoA O-methyltransferase